jgi:Zn-finger nucleic acid-binding protein
MLCPACGRELQPKEVGDITVDVCDGGCGGIWFDCHELEKVDEQQEVAGEALLGITRQTSEPRSDPALRRCPKCPDQHLFRHFHSVRRQVEVDDCPRCGGVWLDVGELAAIRAQFPTDEERRRAAEGYFDEVFGRQLDEIHAESARGEQRARRISNALRFICPSYYIPGKQRGGAF